MSEAKAMPTGWALLHHKLPQQAFKPISRDVYGVEGLTDVNEGYLIQRLFASGLVWHWRITGQDYLGHEDREVRNKDYTSRYYLASVQGVLLIDGREFHGSGAHDNRKVDAAFKGAATVAFKNAAKIAGLYIELLLDGKSIDFIYEDRAVVSASVAGSDNGNVTGGPPPVDALPAAEVVDTRSGELGESQNHGQPAAPLSTQELATAAPAPETRKRGRPPGSKNRPKEEETSPPLGVASESAPPVQEFGNFDNADGLVPEAPPPPPLTLDPLQETRDRVWDLAMKLRAKQYALLGREVGGEELIEKTSQALSIYLQNQYGEKTALIDLNGYQLEETLEHVQGELAKRGG